MDKDMFTEPRIIAAREGSHPVLTVVTCVKCGCLVVDTDIHEKFHKNHGHVGEGFTNEWLT
jgi:hypothetical protein